jgi:hypothetical protein
MSARTGRWFPSTIEGGQIRCALSRSITDQQLMFEKQRLCGDGTYTTPAHEFRDGDKKVDGEHEQVAHGVNGTTPANVCKTARFM